MHLVSATHSSGLVRAEHPLTRPGLSVVLGRPQCTLLPSLACRRRYQPTLRARRGPKSVTLLPSTCAGVEVNCGTPDPVRLKSNVELAPRGRSMSLHEVYSKVSRGKGHGWCVALGQILGVSDPNPQEKTFLPYARVVYLIGLGRSPSDPRGNGKPLVRS